MLAFAFIPCAPRIARADGPIIDADVQRLMDEKPDEEHALIVSVELCRTPLNLAELLPTPDETNECTRRWRACETLAEEFEEGCNENLTQEMVDAAHAEAKAYDDEIVAIQEAAYKAYHEDYASIVAESVPDVYESLRSVLGENVRRVSESSKLLAIRADRRAFEAIRETASIKRVSFDIPMGPMLDKSRKNILADEVHCSVSSIPYKGSGVRLAIVDDGVMLHSRLPAANERVSNDFSIDTSSCQDADNGCSPGHGTTVAGVVFCQPNVANPCSGGEGYDEHVGIAYEATLINAKVRYSNTLPTCCTAFPSESWARTLPAFSWAVSSNNGGNADLINYCRGAVAIGADDTRASSIYSMNVDYIVYTSGSSFVHSCGNTSVTDEISPPSGAYNCISVGNYDDLGGDGDARDANVISDTTSPGTTDDDRRKPDLCAPGISIHTTYGFSSGFENASGTSLAAPHVSGVIALLKQARPSIKTSEIHAVLVNTTDWALLVDGQTRQSAWDEQGGWGMLNALTAVAQRNRIVTGILDDPDDAVTYYLASVPANDEVVITGVWERSMADEDTPVVDANNYPSPANLDIILQKKSPGGDWSDAATTVGTYAPDDGNPEDNARQVRYTQHGQGAELEFRVKVKHNPTQDNPFEGAQTFSLASRHAFQ